MLEQSSFSTDELYETLQENNNTLPCKYCHFIKWVAQYASMDNFKLCNIDGQTIMSLMCPRNNITWPSDDIIQNPIKDYSAKFINYHVNVGQLVPQFPNCKCSNCILEFYITTNKYSHVHFISMNEKHKQYTLPQMLMTRYG
eukprot:104234_1